MQFARLLTSCPHTRGTVADASAICHKLCQKPLAHKLKYQLDIVFRTVLDDHRLDVLRLDIQDPSPNPVFNRENRAFEDVFDTLLWSVR